MSALSIDAEVMAVLSTAEARGNTLAITGGQLERQLYVRVDKILRAAGGKWDRKARAHVFEDEAEAIVDGLIMTGSVRRLKQDLGQFDTPPNLAEFVVQFADIKTGMKVLEPSAGIGNLVAAAEAAGGQVFAYEIDDKRSRVCKATHSVSLGIGTRDFLAVDPAPVFERVVMNPPFARQADISHVRRALQFLKPDGRLVAIMSAGARFRRDQRALAFRELLLRRGGYFVDLPDRSFVASGTAVRACLLVVPAREESTR